MSWKMVLAVMGGGKVGGDEEGEKSSSRSSAVSLLLLLWVDSSEADNGLLVEMFTVVVLESKDRTSSAKIRVCKRGKSILEKGLKYVIKR